MSDPEELLILSKLPTWGSGKDGKSTSELSREFSLKTDKMLRQLERLERNWQVRRMPRGGYIWFQK